MEINDKVLKEILTILIIIVFAVLVFLSIKPIIFAVLWGLILAYIFMPVFNKTHKYIKNKTLAATIVLVIALLIVIIPLWLLTPMMVQEVYELFKASQSIDAYKIVANLFPGASAQFSAQLAIALNSLISKATSFVLAYMVDFFVNIPLILLNIAIGAFVFFFSLRDGDKMKAFIKGISPLNKTKEKQLTKSFADMTYSIIYGRLVVGIIQGLLAGLGFWIFGIPNVLVLTLMAIFLAVLPFLGVFIVWIPIAIFLFATGHTGAAIAFVLYNAIIVSNIDNVLLSWIISRKTNLSTPFALISSIGGLLLFGFIGIILGPLIFAYFIILIDWYKEKNLLSLFSKDAESESVSAS